MKKLTSHSFTEALASREGYRVLGDDLNSWTQGGCWVLAEAIKKWIGPRCALYCVRGEAPLQYQGGKPVVFGPLVVHHVIARIGGFYLDADGVDEGQRRVLGTWTHTEHLRNVSLETFLPRYRKAALEDGLVCPPAAVKRVAAFLEKKFGPGAKATAWMGGEEVRPNPSVPPASSGGVADAIDHITDGAGCASDFHETKRSWVKIKALPTDLSSWPEWSPGELSGLSPADLHRVLVKFRGETWANRAETWIRTHSVPTVVVVDTGDQLDLSDGRGRISLAIGLGWKQVPASFWERVRSNPSAPLVMYHGSQRWEGSPRVVPHKKGHAEAGAGIYMTTSFETAQKYAKGGGSVIRFELDPDIRWLEQARLSTDEIAAFISRKGLLRSRQRDLIGSDLLTSRQRSNDGTIPAAVLLNLMVNHEAISGAAGVALAEFYVRHGIDASHDRRGSEDWVVLFNPKKIRTWIKVKSSDVPVSDYDLPRIVRSNPLIPWWT